jgi:hypothetical protein
MPAESEQAESSDVSVSYPILHRMHQATQTMIRSDWYSSPNDVHRMHQATQTMIRSDWYSSPNDVHRMHQATQTIISQGIQRMISQVTQTFICSDWETTLEAAWRKYIPGRLGPTDYFGFARM